MDVRLRSSLISPRRAVLLLLAMLGLAWHVTVAAQVLEVRGRVEGMTGEEAARAWVRLRPVTSSYEAGNRLLEGEGAAEDAGEAVPGQVGRDGELSVSAPQPGMWAVEVGAPGRLTVRRWQVPLLADALLPPVELPRDVGLEVRVIDPAGESVPEARVWVQSVRDGPWGRLEPSQWGGAPRRGLSDEDGRLRLPRAARETLVLRAWAPGFLPARLDVAATSGRAAIRFDAAPPRPLRVVDADGEPLAAVLIRLDGAPVARTGDNGEARPALPAAGAVTLELDAGGGWRGSVELAEAAKREDGSTSAGPAVAVLTLEPPQRLDGVVLDAALDTPVAGALVWSWGESANAVSSDGRGRFSLTLPPQAGTLYAAAVDHRLARMKAETLLARDAASATPAIIRLQPAAAVAGRVANEAGEPVAGARVRVRSARIGDRPWQASELEGETKSGAGGAFRLAGLSAGETYALRVDAAGFAPLETTAAAGGEPATLTLAPGVSLTGRVLDPYGAPVQGARVRLFEASFDGAIRMVLINGERLSDHQAWSDDEGRFTVVDLAPGLYDLEIRSPQWASWERLGVEMAPARSHDLGDVILDPAVTLRGRVVDSAGAAVAGAKVWIDPLAGFLGRTRGVSMSGEQPGVDSDEDGRFRLPGLAAEGAVTVKLQHRDYLPAEVADVVPSDEPLEVVLEPAARVFGQVVGPAGEPLSGAWLWGDTTVHVVTAHGDGMSSYSVNGFSDEDGRFSIGGVRPGELVLTARADGLALRRLEAIRVQAGQRVGPLRVEMAKGAVLEGRVRTAGGEPAAGVAVSVDMGGQQQGAVSDDEGRYRVSDLPQGEAQVRAEIVATGLQARAALTIRPGEQRLDLTLEPHPAVGGRVVDADGMPVAGASVSVEGPLDGSTARFSSSFESGADGRFFNAVLPGPGVYRLIARAATGYAEQEVEVGAGAVGGIELRLEPAAEVVGRILGLEPDELPQVLVHLWRPQGGSSIQGWVSDGGDYRVAAVPAGKWRLQALHRPSGRRAEAELMVTAGETVVRDLRFEPQVEGNAAVSGLLRVRGGPPGPTWVFLLPVDLRSGARMAEAEVAPDGTFRAEDLVPGRYRVSVARGVVAPGPLREIDVEGEVELLLDLPTVAVAGNLRTPVGTPVAGARVQLVAAQGHGSSASITLYTDDQGRFRIPHVLPGPYRLQYAKTDRAAAPVELPVEVPAEGLPDLEVVMK